MEAENSSKGLPIRRAMALALASSSVITSYPVNLLVH